MYPWPVAHTLLDGKRFKIYEADLAEGQGQAGHIIEKNQEEFGSCDWPRSYFA